MRVFTAAPNYFLEKEGVRERAQPLPRFGRGLSGLRFRAAVRLHAGVCRLLLGRCEIVRQRIVKLFAERRLLHRLQCRRRGWCRQRFHCATFTAETRPLYDIEVRTRTTTEAGLHMLVG